MRVLFQSGSAFLQAGLRIPDSVNPEANADMLIETAMIQTHWSLWLATTRVRIFVPEQVGIVRYITRDVSAPI